MAVLSERISPLSGVASSLGLIILRKNQQYESTVSLLSVDLLNGVASGSTKGFSIDEDPCRKADLSLEGLGREFVAERS